MLLRYVEIDRLTIVAPLGVRFYDPVTRRLITELTVTAAPKMLPNSGTPMFPNPSGVFVLHHLQNKREWEAGAGDAEFWSQPRPVQRYVVSVSDPRRQYLPFTFEADVPAKGLLFWDCDPLASPTDEGSDVPLFSTPNRQTPAGFGVVRADLYDMQENREAAYAVLDVSYEGALLGRGIADERGRVAVFVPYPMPIDTMPLSLLVTGTTVIGQQWRLDLRVSYAPTSPPPSEPIDLCEILNQVNAAPADVWETRGNPPGNQRLTDAALDYGRELILRTTEGGVPLSKLYIAPAGSPP